MTEKISYPVIDAVRWWALRRQFKNKSIPAEVNVQYLSTVLGVQPGSAQNILSPLKKIGLIDQDGKTTDRVRRWRDDEEYPGVCEEIRKAIYPQDLLDIFPNADIDRARLERWFATTTGLGTTQVRSMARFYILLTEADPSKQEGTATPAKASQPRKAASPRTKAPAIKISKPEKEASNGAVATAVLEPEVKQNAARAQVNGFEPSLQINIQIHISADASAEQIDQIFASMNKHLYKGSSVHE